MDLDDEQDLRVKKSKTQSGGCVISASDVVKVGLSEQPCGAQ